MKTNKEGLIKTRACLKSGIKHNLKTIADGQLVIDINVFQQNNLANPLITQIHSGIQLCMIIIRIEKNMCDKTLKLVMESFTFTGSV